MFVQLSICQWNLVIFSDLTNSGFKGNEVDVVYNIKLYGMDFVCFFFPDNNPFNQKKKSI